jgi:hypothetical protein
LNGSVTFVSAFYGLCLPYLIIYLFTGFRKGQSTLEQQAWTISWLVANQLTGLSMFDLNIKHPAVSFVSTRGRDWVHQALMTAFSFLTHLFTPLIPGNIPAIGGFVTVGKMLFEFGTCSLYE